MAFKFVRFSEKADYQRAPSSEDEEGRQTPEEIGLAHKRQTKRLSWGWVISIANLLLFAVNTSLLFMNTTHKTTNAPEIDFVIPPLQNIISHDIRESDVGIGKVSPYGKDTPEADELWKEISQDGPYGWVTVQKEDLERINQTSVRLVDGSGYLAGLEVYHELHCLNWFRRKVLGKEFGDLEDPMPEYHLSHCLDILRYSIQCHADLSLMPLRWVEGYPFPWPVFQTTRKCRRWDDIFTWTKEHSIGAAGRVVHPHLGPVDGKDFDPEKLPHPGHLVFIDED